jgi:4-hydroxy-2-oxoheptanedioate aldolase
MRPNTVKQLLREGKPALGTWLSLGNALAAEQLTRLGFDWLNIDQEHAPIDATLTLHLLQAISLGGAIPLCRVPWNEPVWIKRCLDAGAYGVVVPMVNSRAEAEQAVAACKYPPAGTRGIGGLRTRLYGGADYVERANDEILVVIQIEHIEAVERADEILSVPGIDAYFVGPNDLCASMGLKPATEPDHPQYHDALEHVKQVAAGYHVAAGLHVGSAETARHYIEGGYQFIALASDGALLASAADAILKGARARPGAGLGPETDATKRGY